MSIKSIRRRYRIKDDNVAKSLGLYLKKSKRYDLNDQQEKEYLSKRQKKLTNKASSKTSANNYNEDVFFLSAYCKETNTVLGIEDYCKKYNQPFENISSWKFLPYHYKEPSYNIVFKENFIKESSIDFENIFNTKIEPIKIALNKTKGLNGLFDRAVYTDAHINMNPNPTGFSLYGGRWNIEDINDRNSSFVNDIISDQNSRILYLDDLGDFMDGLNGQTTRGGHELPQLMPDQDAYDVGLSFKIKMIDALIPFYDKIVCHNVCNDNHAGSFGYFVNSAFKKYIELKYPKRVEVINLRKFINHYIVYTGGKYDYGFILCHGKDEKEKKFGMNPKLVDKDRAFIDDYIDENYLCRKNLVLEFSKGDSHQKLFDDTSSSRFYYYNYLAFSPSSNYIQTNYKKGKSGFDFFNYIEGKKRPKMNPDEFEWIIAS